MECIPATTTALQLYPVTFLSLTATQLREGRETNLLHAPVALRVLQHLREWVERYGAFGSGDEALKRHGDDVCAAWAEGGGELEEMESRLLDG